MAFDRPLFPFSRRHTRTALLLGAIGASALLVILAWRWQTIEAARNEAYRRHEAAADAVVVSLDQIIAATEEKLRDPELMRFLATTPDSISVMFGDGHLDAFPHGRLLYYPVPSPGSAAPDSTFKDGEALEYERKDHKRAAEWFQQLAAQASAPVRAGALVRAARNLRKAGVHDDALVAYSDAARLATTAIGEVPTELFARSAICEILEQLGRTADLAREALELRELLLDGRWRITRSVFERHLEAASGWARAGEPPATHRLALSDAVAGQPFPPPSGDGGPADVSATTRARSTMTARGMQFTILAQTIGKRRNSFIAGPLFIEHEWKARIGAVEKQYGVRVMLQDTTGRGGAPGASRRLAADTGLPWTITVGGAQVQK